MNSDKEKILELSKSVFGIEPTNILSLKADGSNRKIYRLFVEDQTFIAVVGENLKENQAFVSFTNSFQNFGYNVPKIVAVSQDEMLYFQTDLGDETLYGRLSASRQINPVQNLNSELKNIYKKVVTHLIKFQTSDLTQIDLDKSYPYKYFNDVSIKWDLNYFKYNFLKLANIEFDEYALEQDFIKLTQDLTKGYNEFFLYRDFQSRNVMIIEDEPYFIDYQGGRIGALEYDLASLLYDAKANLSDIDKEELLSFYVSEITKFVQIDELKFRFRFLQNALIRILQAMGAYGFRGLFEKKMHFIASIKYAINNLDKLKEHDILIDYPELSKIVDILKASNFQGRWEIETPYNSDKLKIAIKSFSYKNGYPVDYTGNGGGFVFDCRNVENPGRYKEYKSKSGLDSDVKVFLEAIPESHYYIQDVENIVSKSIEKYLAREFKNLSINFGCTGGQHRSVYFAEKLKSILSEKYGDKIYIEITHTNSKNWMK